MQPPPLKTDTHEVWPLIVADLETGNAHVLVDPAYGALREPLRQACLARDSFGRAKYGTPLQVENGREPLSDALDEAMDAMAYTRQYYERQKTREAQLRAWKLHLAAVALAVMVLEEREVRS